MSCISCNKKIEAVMKISEGKASALAEKLFGIEIAKCENYDLRMTICLACRQRSYLSKLEYARWLLTHGVKVVKNIEDLTVLPALPKQPEDKNKLMFCRLCKCDLDAKCRVKSEQCPMGRWF